MPIAGILDIIVPTALEAKKEIHRLYHILATFVSQNHTMAMLVSCPGYVCIHYTLATFASHTRDVWITHWTTCVSYTDACITHTQHLNHRYTTFVSHTGHVFITHWPRLYHALATCVLHIGHACITHWLRVNYILTTLVSRTGYVYMYYTPR